MNKLTEEFIKKSGITRDDKDWLLVPESSRIFLREGDDCTPVELLKKIVNSGKNHRRLQIFNLIGNPV